MKIPVFELGGHEADDIIAYLARKAAAEGVDVRVVTGDRDFFQLVNDDIKVLYNRRGITDIVEMDAKAVEDRYGVPPVKYVDLKALEGDNSDNLPGVPGVGTKTAAKLVQKYGSAEEVVAHADEQTPKLAANLAEHADQVAINKKLSTLAEVPLEEVGLDDLKMGAWDLDELRELYQSLEFRTLLERLLSDLPEAAEGEGTPFEVDLRVVEDVAGLKELAGDLQTAAEFAVDLIPISARGAPRAVAFSWGQGVVAYLNVGSAGFPLDEFREHLGPVFADEAIAKLAHGARKVILSLEAAGMEVEGLRLDYADCCVLAGPRRGRLSARRTGTEVHGTGVEVGRSRRARGRGSGIARSRGRPRPWRGGGRQPPRAGDRQRSPASVEPELDRLGMADLYQTIEHPMVDVLARTEQIGIKIDLDYLAEMARDLDKRISELEAECYDLAGERINLGSPQQLRILLYDKLGLKRPRAGRRPVCPRMPALSNNSSISIRSCRSFSTIASSRS